VLAESIHAAVTIIATGTEVALALKVREELERLKILTTVVSAPCLNIFDKQSEEYRNTVINPNTLKVAIEAGGSYGWQKYIGRDGLFFGIKDNSFGVSGPAGEVYEHFGISESHIVNTLARHMKKQQYPSLSPRV
jgi:transketolase